MYESNLPIVHSTANCKTLAPDQTCGGLSVIYINQRLSSTDFAFHNGPCGGNRYLLYYCWLGWWWTAIRQNSKKRTLLHGDLTHSSVHSIYQLLFRIIYMTRWGIYIISLSWTPKSRISLESRDGQMFYLYTPRKALNKFANDTHFILLY